jgi:ATP-dependent RNA helicase RhlB
MEPEVEEVEEEKRSSFDIFDLKQPLRDAIAKLGFEFCTPIQAESLVHTLAGLDVTGKAQTGTGKTAAFLITIINDLLSNPIKGERYLAEPRALVVAPTRELAIQIASDAQQLTEFCDLHTVTLVGGEDYQKQNRGLDAKPVDLIVATPGRLLDFVQNGNLHLGGIELLVLDEADRMLDMGFIPQVRQVVARTPRKECRQTLLFSATFTPQIVELTERWAMDPVMVEVEGENVAADDINQMVYLVTTVDKYNLLYNIISEPNAKKVLVFSNRRDQVRKLADNLYRNGINCGLLSGEVAQNKRIKTLEAFKSGELQVLVATDVAGRGLHIDDVTHVINYTLPEEADDYVHRIGRTGRAGAIGTSISFACEEDSFLLPAIEEKLGIKLDCIHPDEHLLEKAPSYVRASVFKASPDSRGSSKSKGGRRPPRSR